MPVCYNKLWKLLIDKGMSKTDLIKASKIILPLLSFPSGIEKKSPWKPVLRMVKSI